MGPGIRSGGACAPTAELAPQGGVPGRAAGDEVAAPDPELAALAALGNHLCGALQDELDRKGVPNELLVDMAASERSSFQAATNSKGQALPPQVRSLALRFMEHLACKQGLPQTSWLTAALLLDLYCLRVPGGICIETLPATCVAVVHVMKKNDTVFAGHVSQWCQLATRQFAQVVGVWGFAVVEAQDGTMVAKQERSLLQALGWQINVPSLDAWMSTFTGRFNVLTGGMFAVSMTLVYQTGIALGGRVVARLPTSPQLPPRTLAIAATGLGCVYAHLLPHETLQAAGHPPPEGWEHIFDAVANQSALPVCALNPAYSQRVLELLQVSMACRVAELQEAVRIVALALGDAA